MINIPTKISERLVSGIKKFQPILDSAKTRDINESDTVLIITNMLSDVFGFDKYSEITSEFAIRGTYCDLATCIDGKIQYLIEVKAIGSGLKDQHIQQAVGYASKLGTDWVILTNGIHWHVYKITFGKPIEQELVVAIDFLQLNSKDVSHLEMLYCISKEGCNKSVLSEFHSRKQVLSKYFISNVILSEPILNAIRKELKKLEPDIKTEIEQIELIISQEIFKRELLESEKTHDAKKRINRIVAKQKRVKEKSKNDSNIVDNIDEESQTQQEEVES